MKLTFWGAAQQVTGSMHLLEIDNDYRILIDCGSDFESGERGRKSKDDDDEQEELPKITNTALFPFEASAVNLVLLTHAHIDHSGNIPNLYREGYEGQVLCTEATYSLTAVLLKDAASLNQKRLSNVQKGDSKRKGKKKKE
ncbi:MAG: MBL fold metallo-hydrolase, partial [Runella slithyformis]